jgi:predicted RNase H-like HicB family nuclease
VQRIIKAHIYKGDKYYIAECHGIGVVTQGETLDRTVANLREAIALHLEGEDLSEYDLVPDPTILVTIELEPITYAA